MIAERRTAVGHLVHAVRGHSRLRHRHHLRLAARAWRCGTRCSSRGWSSPSSSPSTACRRSRWRRSSCCGSAPASSRRSRLSVSLTAIVALIAAYQAAKDADVDLQSLLISMGANKHQVFFKAVVPSTLAVDHRDVPHQCRLRPGRRRRRRVHLVAARPRPHDLHRLQPVRPQHGLGRAVHADDHGFRPLLRDRHHRAHQPALEAGRAPRHQVQV